MSDDELFKDPPSKEDCEICFLPMTYAQTTHVRKTMPCCGKIVCIGCVTAANEQILKKTIKSCCPFCRMALPRTSNEFVKRLKNRMELLDAEAFYELAMKYDKGSMGLRQDTNKAIP